ncbi:MAG TPA: carbonic anhydrase, partial [Candidatus Angelobacter sp.]|nr:carbonic anhydrase [Candidatus Angelobacter sp.]
GKAPEDEKLRLMTEHNVLGQIEHLKTHPSVWSRLLRGEIEIRGWLYDIGDGSISEFNEATGKFERMGATS